MSGTVKKYKSTYESKKLSKNQRNKVTLFLEQFLPKTGEKRRYPGNSIESVHKSINAVLKKKSDFQISLVELFEVLKSKGYSFVLVQGEKNAKVFKGDPELVFQEHVESLKKWNWSEYSIHVDISASICNEIRKCGKPIFFHPEGNSEKENQRIEFRKHINDFFYGSGQLLEEDLPSTIRNVIGTSSSLSIEELLQVL